MDRQEHMAELGGNQPRSPCSHSHPVAAPAYWRFRKCLGLVVPVCCVAAVTTNCSTGCESVGLGSGAVVPTLTVIAEFVTFLSQSLSQPL